jgi:hypothetical protein
MASGIGDATKSPRPVPVQPKQPAPSQPVKTGAAPPSGALPTATPASQPWQAKGTSSTVAPSSHRDGMAAPAPASAHTAPGSSSAADALLRREVSAPANPALESELAAQRRGLTAGPPADALAKAALPAARAGPDGARFEYSYDAKNRALVVSCKQPVLDDDTGRPTGRSTQLADTRVPVPKNATAQDLEHLARRTDATLEQLYPERKGFAALSGKSLPPEMALGQLEKAMDFGEKARKANTSTLGAAEHLEGLLGRNGVKGVKLEPAVPMDKQIAAFTKVAGDVTQAANPDQVLVDKAVSAAHNRGESVLPDGSHGGADSSSFDALLKKGSAGKTPSPNEIVGDLNGKPVTRAEVEKLAQAEALKKAEAIKVTIPGFADNGSPVDLELQVEPKKGGGYSWSYQGPAESQFSSKRPLHTGDFTPEGLASLYNSLESQKRYSPSSAGDWKPTRELPTATTAAAAVKGAEKVETERSAKAAAASELKVTEAADLKAHVEADKGSSFSELLNRSTAPPAGAGAPRVADVDGGAKHGAPELPDAHGAHGTHGVPGSKALGKLGVIGGAGAVIASLAQTASAGESLEGMAKGAAIEAARGFIPGADSTIAAVEGRGAEALMRGVEEVPVAGLVASEALRPLGRALGFDLDSSLLEDAAVSGAEDAKLRSAKNQAAAQLAKEFGAVPANRPITDLRVVRMDSADDANAKVHFLLGEDGKLYPKHPAGEAIPSGLDPGKGSLVIGIVRPDRKAGLSSESVSEAQKREAGLFLGAAMHGNNVFGMGTVKWERFSEREQLALAPRL